MDPNQNTNTIANVSTNPEITRITITFPTNAYFISGLRDFTLNMIKNTTNFSEKWAYRFQSVVDELCNNAIEHGSTPGKDVTIVFSYAKDNWLEIEVYDTGTGPQKISATQLKDIFTTRSESGYIFNGIRGRGLAKIVGEWTDEIDFSDISNGGLKVRVRKYLNDPRFQDATQSEQKDLILSNI